jgi:hypothetical protein
LYGDARLAALYAIRTRDDEPAILSADAEAVLVVGDSLARALEDALAVDRAALPPAAAVVVQGDAWGARERLGATPVSTTESAALVGALDALVTHLAAPTDGGSVRLRPSAAAVLLAGWRELDTEHPSLMHERAFGMRRLFRIFVRGDHEARALMSQLVGWDASGRAYLSEVPGELEVLELDDDGPTLARIFHLDREALGCGDVILREESEVRRIPDLGADSFLLDLANAEPLSTMPCARCHEDRGAFSLPTDRTYVRDRLGGHLARIEEAERSRASARVPSDQGTQPRSPQPE